MWHLHWDTGSHSPQTGTLLTWRTDNDITWWTLINMWPKNFCYYSVPISKLKVGSRGFSNMIYLLHSDSHCSVILIWGRRCMVPNTHMCNFLFNRWSNFSHNKPSLLASLINQTIHGIKCTHIFKKGPSMQITHGRSVPSPWKSLVTFSWVKASYRKTSMK